MVQDDKEDIMIEVSVNCPECNYEHVIDVIINKEWDEGDITCSCGEIIIFTRDEVVHN